MQSYSLCSIYQRETKIGARIANSGIEIFVIKKGVLAPKQRFGTEKHSTEK